MWLCVSFFAEGKIKDIVNSAEDVLNEFPVLSLVIAITQKTKFVANANNFWVSSSVKILAHTTECILVETNSLEKTGLNARKRAGAGGGLAAARRPHSDR